MTDDTGTQDEKPQVGSLDNCTSKPNPTLDSKPSGNGKPTDPSLPNPDDTEFPATSAGSDPFCQPSTTENKTDNGSSSQPLEYGPFVILTQQVLPEMTWSLDFRIRTKQMRLF